MPNIKYTNSADFRCLEHLKETSLDLYLMCCGWEQCKPSHICSEKRNEYIIHFVLSGKGTFQTNGQSYALEAGKMFLIRPQTEYSYSSDAEDPWHYTWIGFNGIQADYLLKNCGFSGQTVVLDFTHPEQITGHINNILDARHLTYANALRRKSEFQLLFADLVDEYSKVHRTQLNYGSNVYLYHAVEYIKCAYKRGINVTDVTEYVGLSRTYLNQLFQKELGVSIQKFLMDYRLHKAANLLLSTNLTISEVSNSVGYNDPLAFSKVFKKKFEMSPKSYREHKEEMDIFKEKQL